MEFVNRHNEQKRLNKLLLRSEGSFSVIFGRRRVGKTRLLLEWIKKHRGIYWVADESTPTLQRRYFAQTLAAQLPGFADVEYPNWTAFFQRLQHEASAQKFTGPLVIDELPYLIQAANELPSILQRFVDHSLKTCRMHLAVAGSSQHLMHGLALDASAPLYGRADEIMKIIPISAAYLGEALKIKNHRQIVEAYSIFGGIPRYWELAQHFDNLPEAIDALLLDPLGPLFEEPVHLLQEETPNLMSLKPILESIGFGSHRLSEIASRLGMPATSLQRPLQRLQDLDLITREIPFGDDENFSKKALYKLCDPLMCFWFGFIASQKSLLLQTRAQNRLSLVSKALPQQQAFVWETLCRQAIPKITLLETEFGIAKRFWHKQGFEWDVVAESLDGKTLLLGEVKWTQKRPTETFIKTTFEELLRKGLPPISKKYSQIIYVVFVPEKPLQIELAPNTLLLDAQDVLSALK